MLYSVDKCVLHLEPYIMRFSWVQQFYHQSIALLAFIQISIVLYMLQLIQDSMPLSFEYANDLCSTMVASNLACPHSYRMCGLLLCCVIVLCMHGVSLV